jgi:hypothetical protein
VSDGGVVAVKWRAMVGQGSNPAAGTWVVASLLPQPTMPPLLVCPDS